MGRNGSNKRNAPSANEAAAKRVHRSAVDADNTGHGGRAESPQSGTLSDVSVPEIKRDSTPDEDDRDPNAVTLSTRPYFDAEIVARLNLLNTYANLDTGCATLHTVNFDKLTWGNINGDRGIRPDYLYYQGNVCTLWMVGELTYRTFSSQGHNVRRPSVRILPLLEVDLSNGVQLQNKWARPAKDDDHDRLGLWASRWVGDQSMTDEQIPPFDRVYDATYTYRRKVDMDKIAASSLKLGDIVLAEVFVTRWMPKEEPAEGASSTASTSTAKKQQRRRSGKRDWKTWNVEFRLDALSLLYPGSEHYTKDSKPDEDVEL